jgi:hypothetical protein
MEGCEAKVKKLEELLARLQREESPETLRAKIRKLNRRMLHVFHASEVRRLQHS